jgi:3-oxoacyl-(acyl-carrier-protein) synthase
MFHFTGNRPDGSGFDRCAASIAEVAASRRVWVKGHGTGTLEAGRLEAEAVARRFPGAPLVSWKGSLGHTLGSCGLVELAVAVAALREGRIPGTVGGGDPSFVDSVALAPFSSAGFDGAVLGCNAFGGAHAALLLTYD